MNKHIVVGKLGQDPELKYVGDNKTPLATVSLAVNKTKNRTETNWFRVQFWGKTAEMVVKYFKKGDSMGVCGEGDLGKYKNKDGVEVTSYTIINADVSFLPHNKVNAEEKLEEEPAATKPKKKGSPTHTSPVSDDVPF